MIREGVEKTQMGRVGRQCEAVLCCGTRGQVGRCTGGCGWMDGRACEVDAGEGPRRDDVI